MLKVVRRWFVERHLNPTVVRVKNAQNSLRRIAVITAITGALKHRKFLCPSSCRTNDARLRYFSLRSWHPEPDSLGLLDRTVDSLIQLAFQLFRTRSSGAFGIRKVGGEETAECLVRWIVHLSAFGICLSFHAYFFVTHTVCLQAKALCC